MNNVIKEIQRITNLEKNKVLLALEKLYNHLDYSIINIHDDWVADYLTLTDGNILWYLDNNKEAGIRIETCKLLNKEELSELLNEYIAGECDKHDN